MFKKRTCLKGIRLLVICLGIVLSLGKTAFSWEAEYAVYSNPALSFDEEKIVFEYHHYISESAEGETGLSDVMMINVDGSNPTSLTYSVGRAIPSPDKSKILLDWLLVLDLENKNIRKRIFDNNRYSKISCFSWSADSQKVLFLGHVYEQDEYDYIQDDYNLIILNYQTGKAEILDKINYSDGNNAPAFSPDSKFVAYVKEGNIWIIDIEDKTKVQLTTLAPSHLVWSLDGKVIFYLQSGNIWAINVKDKKQVQLTTFVESEITSISEICLSPDNKKILFIKNFDDLKILDLETKAVKDLISQKGTISNVVYSSDGSKIIFNIEGEIWVMDYSDTSKMEKVIKGLAPQWISKDEIIFIDVESLYSMDLKTKIPVRLTIPNGTSPVWFQDNKRIAMESEGAFWVINLEKWGIEKIDKLPDVAPQYKRKKFSVFLKKYQSDKHIGIYEGADYAKEANEANEIWVKRRDTFETYRVMEASANF